MALGITGSATGVGTVVMAPFATYLISNFDWHMSFIIIGLISWTVAIPLSLLLIRSPYDIVNLPDG